MNTNYLKNCKRVFGNSLLQSGVCLGKNLGLFEALHGVGKPCDIASLAHLTKTKEPYLRELVFSFVSSGLLGFQNNEVFVPDWKVFKEVFVSQELKYIKPFEDVSPILENCFTEKGPFGYGHDEAPFVMEFILSRRANYNVPIAKALAEVIKVHAKKYADVLDLGCGSGDLTIPFAKEMNASKVQGCDNSEKAIFNAKIASFDVPNLHLSVRDIHKLPEDWTEKFDIILLYDVLHDLQFPNKAMKQVMRVLKKGGIVIIVDPKVSSNPSENIGNILSAEALTYSTWWCIPSSSCNHGSGHGVGWGWQNKEKFLSGIPGLEIKSRVCLINSNYNFAYICKKE
ncbi:S-adenosylmethionine-dependent methyltransferase Rv2258c-like [Argopecten irradians]|uniref:S-adenosylmethionine-dependent methyltransferase Rv2258c-like n=1 Tax=Argopecten irradians TaxID=31199 RepID=UPI003712C455